MRRSVSWEAPPGFSGPQTNSSGGRSLPAAQPPSHDLAVGCSREPDARDDDHSRLAFSKILPDESARSAAAFLTDALAFFHRLAIPVQRLLTDDGGCYRSRLFNQRCEQASIRHLYTRPFTPRTNGKAERFIQTVLREWAYAHTYQSSEQRAAQLPAWLHRYNWHRPHTSLHHRPPIQALDFPLNNLVSLHT